MNLTSIREEIAAKLDAIDGLRAFAWPNSSTPPPVGVVMLPTRLDFDATFQRGADQLDVDVVVYVGRTDQRTSYDLISDYCAGSGASSVKAALETGTYTSFDSLRVRDVEFGVVTVAGVDYLAATFGVDLIGDGAS